MTTLTADDIPRLEDLEQAGAWVEILDRNERVVRSGLIYAWMHTTAIFKPVPAKSLIRSQPIDWVGRVWFVGDDGPTSIDTREGQAFRLTPAVG